MPALVFPNAACAFGIQIVTPYLVANVAAETELLASRWLVALRAAVGAIARVPGARLRFATVTATQPVLLAARRMLCPAPAQAAMLLNVTQRASSTTNAKNAVDGSYDVFFDAGFAMGIRLKPVGAGARWVLVTAARSGSGVEVGSALMAVDGRPVSGFAHGYHSVVGLLGKGWTGQLRLTFRRPPRGAGFLLEHTPLGKRKLRYCSLEGGVFVVRSTKAEKGDRGGGSWWGSKRKKGSLSEPGDVTLGKGIEPDGLEGFVDLAGASLRVLPRSELKLTDKGEHMHALRLLSGATGALTFQAADVTDLVRWAAALYVAIDMANGGKFVRATIATAEDALAPEAAEVALSDRGWRGDDVSWKLALAELAAADMQAREQAQMRAFQMLSSDNAAAHNAVIIEGMLNKYVLCQ